MFLPIKHVFTKKHIFTKKLVFTKKHMFTIQLFSPKTRFYQKHIFTKNTVFTKKTLSLKNILSSKQKWVQMDPNRPKKINLDKNKDHVGHGFALWPWYTSYDLVHWIGEHQYFKMYFQQFFSEMLQFILKYNVQCI